MVVFIITIRHLGMSFMCGRLLLWFVLQEYNKFDFFTVNPRILITAHQSVKKPFFVSCLQGSVFDYGSLISDMYHVFK